MARINTNVGAVVAQRHLNDAYRALSGTLQRLSSGLRINSGKDDPAGLIVSERLRSEVNAVGQAIQNSQRASNVIATSEGSLNEVSSLLSSIQSLVIGAANTGGVSDDEIKANQLQIDSAIASITRISNSTTFAGRALLNGSLDYLTSGVNNSQLTAVRVFSAQFGSAPFIPINVEVTTSAQPAILRFTTSAITTDVNLQIRGKSGVVTLQFGAGAHASAIARGIQDLAEASGVTAVLSSDWHSGFQIESTGYGSRQFVEVGTLPGSGSFTVYDAGGNAQSRTTGRDVVANINGARVVGDGLIVSHKTGMLDMELTLAASFGSGSSSFAITGGGSMYQVGAHVNVNEQTNLGIQSIASSSLGNTSIGFLSQIVTGQSYDLTTAAGRAQASKIVDEAIRQVSVLRGRLGAFEKNVLDTNVNQLSITMENLMAANSTIRDADFAAETSQLTRNQILVSAGTSVLALANQTPQSVLRLLNG